MDRLFKVEAKIELEIGKGRTWPIKNGYRPGFNFIDNKLTSGSIVLINKDELKPGDTAVVEISFISNELLGEIHIGSQFNFYEGSIKIGHGHILKVIGWVEKHSG